VYVTGLTYSEDFPTKDSFQSVVPGNFNAFVTKLNAAGTGLVYSSYFGGSASGGYGIAVDAMGAAYITGITSSGIFPTVNPIQADIRGQTDAFVLKLSPLGNSIVYATYLGSPGFDDAWAIAVDPSGNAYVTGNVGFSGFPTVNAAQPNFGGGGGVIGCFSGDVFVAKLNATGTALVYSTYLGGFGCELSQGGIAADSLGNAYVTGRTSSPNFPTKNALQPFLKGGADVFVTKFSPIGALVYSTYFGGSNGEIANAIAVDSAANAYITGSTGSTDFPIVNAFQPVIPGSVTAFVAKLNTAGSAIVYSTYLGGSCSSQCATFDGDGGRGVAVDPFGRAHVSGYTHSAEFPLSNSFQSSYGGNGDAFVTVLNTAGNGLVYSTYFGACQRF
jgi:hypothetical protein